MSAPETELPLAGQGRSGSRATETPLRGEGQGGRRSSRYSPTSSAPATEPPLPLAAEGWGGGRATAALLALLTACGATPGPDTRADTDDAADVAVVDDETSGDAPLRGRDPDGDETAALREAMRIAERLRSLRFERPVPVRVQSRAEITDFVRSHIEDDELEEARLFYVALGLLAPDADVRAMVLAVMGEQIAGFYDPRLHTMVVRDDVMQEMTRLTSRGGSILGTPSAMVLVHEYVHALQDQRLGLSSDDDSRSIDAQNAYASLVEGDATLTMLGIGLTGSDRTLDDLTGTPGFLRSQLAAGADAGPEGSELANAPAIFRAPLMSRYLDGLVYVGALHGHERSGFSAIDDAFRAPPLTTEQVLHPERYLAGELPEAITLPALASMPSAGFVALEEETLGELELSVYFARGTATDRDRDAAAGWDGDRIRVYHRPESPAAPAAMAVVWLTAWDDEREALDAESAARRVATTTPPTPVGPPVITRQGRALAITAGLPPDAQAEADAALVTLAGMLR